MIVPTMTPMEKHAQMEKIGGYLLNIPLSKRYSVYRKLAKTKIFPYYITEDTEIPGMGLWTIVYEAESKALIRKGVCTLNAYQTFHVSHAKNPLNIGTGIYLFNGSDYGEIMCQEFPPHYFNRLRERLIEPKGIVQPDFPQLVKTMLRMHHSSMDVAIKGLLLTKGENGMYSIEHDHSKDRQEGYDNFISYHKEGVSLGVSVNNKKYVHFTTFVPNNLLREGQKEMQQKMLAELNVHEYQKRLNPFSMYTKTSFLEKDADI